MTQATIERRPSGRARLRPGAALGRWGLRGVALLYLGLFILLPVAVVAIIAGHVLLVRKHGVVPPYAAKVAAAQPAKETG